MHGVGPGSRHLAHAERADRRLEARFYFDSTCPTCRVTLLRVSTDAGYRTPSHLHSEDELILVTRGSVATGRQVATPGQVVAIPGERRYALVAGAEGCEFLNFRSDISYLVGAPADDPVLETADNQGAVPVDEWAVG